MNKNVRLPEAGDYAAVIDRQNMSIEAVGGAWVKAMRIEQETRHKPSVMERSRVTVNLAGIVEPLDDDNAALDKTYRSTRAFKHGMLNGFEVVELAHDSLIDHQSVINTLGFLLTEQFGESGEQPQWAEMLQQYGEEGLGHLSNQSVESIEVWSEQYDHIIDMQRLYKLGVGATLYAGYYIHKRYIEEQVLEVTRSVNWSELPQSNTGE